VVEPGAGRQHKERREMARKEKCGAVGREKTGGNFHSVTCRRRKWFQQKWEYLTNISTLFSQLIIIRYDIEHTELCYFRTALHKQLSIRRKTSACPNIMEWIVLKPVCMVNFHNTNPISPLISVL
jgi:hypothetical protein